MIDQDYIKKAELYDGRRIPLFDITNVSQGWVVNKNVPSGFWEICKAKLVPMRASRFLGIFPTPATKEVSLSKKRLGSNITFVLVSTDDGYLGGPVLIQDLTRNPYDLMREALAATRNGDHLLSRAKELATYIVTGWRDLH